MIQNDAVVFGMLMVILAGVFWTASLKSRGWKVFYTFVPSILLCYFLPSLLTTFGIVDHEFISPPEGHDGPKSQIYFVATRYLLPAALILLTLSVDLREIFRLGPKAVIMFLAGTVGVVIGGPLAILITRLFAPDLVGGEGPDAVWRGMATVAGSWIGGGANQLAMKELYDPSPGLFTVMATVDVLVAEFWMMFLLIGAGRCAAIDRFFRADSSSIERLKVKMENFSLSQARIPSTADLMLLGGVAFGLTSLSHWLGHELGPWIGENWPALKKYSLHEEFFWLIVLATAFGVLLSFTPVRKLEGAGASKIGTVFIFVLVGVIGLKLDLMEIFRNYGLFLVGLIWMLIHILILFVVGYLIRAPFFFLAIGSKANIGGAASAPVLAAAFHPSLAPVGVLLAVLGYVLGTYGAWLCALMMEYVSR